MILVNSNPATIMTDPETADVTYIEPVTPAMVAKIIERERPDALLPTMGGQTALNVAMALARDGTLERFGVELIGASPEAIAKAEDRELFRQAMAADRARPAAQPRRALARAGARRPGRDRPAGDHPAVLHAGRHRRRHRLQPRGVRADRGLAASTPRRSARC